jgi:hypothetical protein
MRILKMLELWRANKRIKKTMFSCVDFTCATFGWLDCAFTQLDILSYVIFCKPEATSYINEIWEVIESITSRYLLQKHKKNS